MIPVFNNSKHNPPDSYGDCFRACLSSILHKPLPHVLHDGCDADTALQRVNDHLKDDGLAYMQIPIPKVGESDHVLHGLRWAGSLAETPDIHYLFCGLTEKGTGHYIVARGDQIVHNPNPKAEIVSTFEDGWFWMGVIVKRL